jgi:hypothetical protein
VVSAQGQRDSALTDDPCPAALAETVYCKISGFIQKLRMMRLFNEFAALLNGFSSAYLFMAVDDKLNLNC